ncbi:MAG: response regulator transcription factor [Clostridiales bacterium]|nr:response regulator transcription factor [Clostridiales bacterium]
MIYIVEDDLDIRELESYALRSSGFEVTACASGAELFETIVWDPAPQLILLDIMLPGEDGLALLARLRENPATSEAPIMMVTAKSSEIDKVRGLDQGADDYLTKPFGVMELVSRVKALLRRSAPRDPAHEKLVCGGIVMDCDKRSVTCDGQEIELTFKEYELLYALMSGKGTVQSREKLINTVWGYDFAGETRTVDMHVKTLRQKLGENGRNIITVRNVGYRMD